MKNFKRCPVFCLIALSSLIFILNSLYKGILPWEPDHARLYKAADTVGQNIQYLSPEQTKSPNTSPEDQPSSGEGQEYTANKGTPSIPEPPENTGKEFVTVTEDYFNDAVFIGDSRTVGLFEYGGLKERAVFLAKVSLTIYDFDKAAFIRDEASGQYITVEQALQQRAYGKVYLMVGINELGTGTTDTFLEAYRTVVERIRELQPDAVIFVEGIMRVTGDKNQEDPLFNNTNINEKNAAISGLADQEHIFYIDVNEAVCDEEGNLNAEYTSDDVHLKAKYYEIWKAFLLEHGII